MFAQPFAYAKPLGLVHRIIQLSTAPEDLMLDPFGGSGTTAQAARETGRSSIFVEEQGHLIDQYVEPRRFVLSRIPRMDVSSVSFLATPTRKTPDRGGLIISTSKWGFY